MGAAIEVDRVSKRYLLGEHHGKQTSLRETIVRAARRGVSRDDPDTREIWSLRDVSFVVERGSALGIVGANGAGKTTLMKVINGITAPTSGECRTRGRVGSLLEVGAGFHGELTGLENAYLNGAILGMSRREVARRLDDIVEFAGLARFMSTPVKRYSTGMYLRLGFAIAAHVDAHILLVDEALAVGDVEFQRKCIAKLNGIRQSGCTVIFVSHYMSLMARLCPTVMWLDAGRIKLTGPTGEVVDEFLRSFTPIADPMSTAVDPTASAQVVGAALVDTGGRPRARLSADEQAWIQFDLVVREVLPGLDIFCQVETASGVQVLNEAYRDTTPSGIESPGNYCLACRLPPILTPGDYHIGFWLGTPDRELQYQYRAINFAIDGDDDRARRLIRYGADWRSTRTDDHLRP